YRYCWQFRDPCLCLHSVPHGDRTLRKSSPLCRQSDCYLSNLHRRYAMHQHTSSTRCHVARAEKHVYQNRKEKHNKPWCLSLNKSIPLSSSFVFRTHVEDTASSNYKSLNAHKYNQPTEWFPPVFYSGKLQK